MAACCATKSTKRALEAVRLYMTLFMMPAEKYTYVSSRLIKGVFQLGGDVTALVPPLVVERLKAKVPNHDSGKTV